MEIEDEEDEREYLNKKIKKKMIINKDNIEIIPEKKEEEDDYSEERRDSKLNIKKFTTRNSSVQIVQAKDIGRKTSIVLRQRLNKNKNKYSDSFSNLLINKMKKADKLKQYVNDKRIKTRRCPSCAMPYFTHHRQEIPVRLPSGSFMHCRGSIPICAILPTSCRFRGLTVISSGFPFTIIPVTGRSDCC